MTNDKDFLLLLEEFRRRGKEVLLVRSQDVGILRTACERLGIERVIYQDIIPHGVRKSISS